MKTVLCFGDSNTWGYDAATNGRFDRRYPRILQEMLGDEYYIIEEGLPGRTTVFEDPLNEGLCGLNYIYPCLMSHAKIDLLIINLGTNDCKQRFSATAKNIADGVKRLVLKARSADAWNEGAKILIIAPAPIREEVNTSPVAGEMGDCHKKSEELAGEYRKTADLLGCDFLDAKEFVVMNDIDFMHLTQEGHEVMAGVIGKYIKGI